MPSQVTSSIKLFADDTKLYCRVPDDGAGLQADIDALLRWSEKWLLPFNASKCKVMHIGSNNPEHAYTLKGAPVEAVAEERDLGVVIDRQLKFHRQTAAAISKASQMFVVVRRLMKSKLFAPNLNVIFGITTSSKLIINKIYA